MTSIYDRALNTAALDRKANGKSLHSLIEAGPYSAKEALDKGLIDKLGQVKEAEQYMLKQAGTDSELVDFEDYQSGVLRSARTPNALDGANPAIAVITAEGPIITGHGGSDSAFSNEQIIYSDEISDAIYQAIEDKDVKAIVMRVSSPGGSDTASEQILAAVRAAKAAGKPVVVSMGTYAASGGYWIASQASAIVAQPTTLTGSIGVFGGKFALGDGLGRVGIDVRHTTVGGEFAGIYGMGDGFTAKQRAGFAKSIDAVYDGFIARVAEGRKLKPERVREIAKGRVWTGEQALQLGLVDQLGGFYDAVDKAKSLAGLSKSKIRLTFLPAQQSPFQAFERALGVSSTAMRTTAAAAWLLGDPRAQGIMDTMMQARLRDQAHATVLAPTPVN
jgi:protease-4